MKESGLVVNESELTAKTPRTVVENPEFKKYEKVKEESKMVRGCQECAKEKNVRAKLACGHLCCDTCMVKFASKCFLEGKPYDYCGPCDACRKNEKIGRARVMP